MDKAALPPSSPVLPLEFGEDGDRSLKILKEANCNTPVPQASASYPWRYFVITDDDRKLIENTLSYRLAEKNVIENTSWIKPGLASWEWWNGATPLRPQRGLQSRLQP